MNVETYLEAKELYDKYKLCEKVMEYLSDKESVKGQKYLETLKAFVDAFPSGFMMFVHQRMESVGMAFESLKCCDCDKQPEENPEPTDPKEPKFPIGSKVEVISGIGKGDVGVVNEYDMEKDTYYVVSDSFSMWFAESELKAYIDEEPENPEENGGGDTDPTEGE